MPRPNKLGKSFKTLGNRTESTFLLTNMTYEQQLEILRKDYLTKPANRELLKRRARALEIAIQIRDKKKTGLLNSHKGS